MMTRRLSILAPAVLLLAAAPATAQEQMFHACYVPEVGAIYLIGLEGLPAGCLATGHVQISWSEGQAGITDHGNLDGLADDDHPEYVREGEAAGGDLSGVFPEPMVAALRGRALSSTDPNDGQVLVWNATDGVWEPRTSDAAVTDHGELAGLADDDHPEYVREGEAAGGDLGGTLPAPAVVALQGNALATMAPADAQVLTWNATDAQWQPAAPPAGITDHGDLAGLADDDHPEYVREGEAAAGDLSGTFPSPAVAALQGNAVATAAPSGGQVLTWNGTNAEWEPQTPSSGLTDHGNLSGLADDDHPEYVREGEAAAGDLTGTFPTPSVAALQGNAVSTTAPADAQVLTWDAGTSQWGPAARDHGTATGLLDDDHTQYVLADGIRGTTNGFAVTGTYDVGSIPVEGAGTRIMWYPGKAAFRAGRVSGTEWDDANVGIQSIALGTNVTASGPATTAIGVGASASGIWTTAIGIGATAYSPNGGAMALGGNTTASADGALAMGIGTEASGEGSTAMGVNTVANAASATAMGNGTAASGEFSTAMGNGTAASGEFSTAMGGNTTASANYATAMGRGAVATGAIATAMGFFTEAQAAASLVIGRSNVVEGSTDHWVSTDPLFVAGNGGSSPSNALTLYKNGSMTIAGSLTEHSDARLKTGIVPIGSVLEALGPIRPVRFRFRPDTGHPTDPQLGLIAQDVAESFPELVSTDSEGYLSLAYPKLTAVLVRAIQEQQDLIETQREELETQQEVVEAQSALLAELEARLLALEREVRRP